MKPYICSASGEADVLWIYSVISQQSGLSGFFFCKASNVTGAADCFVYPGNAGSCREAGSMAIPAMEHKLVKGLSVTRLLFCLVFLISIQFFFFFTLFAEKKFVHVIQGHQLTDGGLFNIVLTFTELEMHSFKAYHL